MTRSGTLKRLLGARLASIQSTVAAEILISGQANDLSESY